VRGQQAGKPVHLAVLNTGSFAHSFTPDELALNILRAPADSSFNINPDDEPLNARFAPRQDQGEHEVRFQLLVGKRCDETRISRAAQVLNTPPCWQVYYPQPEKADRNRRQAIADTVQIDDPRVQVVALKKSEKGHELIIRLQDTGGRARELALRVKPYRQVIRVAIGPYGLLTLAVRRSAKKLRWRVVDLVERGRRAPR